MSDKPRIAIVGGGVVGSALGRALREAGYPVVAVASRTKRSAQAAAKFIGGEPPPEVIADPAEALGRADCCLVTAPDRALAEIATALGKGDAAAPGCLVAHCAGAVPADVLAPVAARGAAFGALHPLQTFATARKAVEALKGTVFGVEGADDVRPRLAALVRDLGGTVLELSPGTKPLYHAAAAMVSNYTVVLVRAAADCLAKVGASPESALAALLPLLRGTVANLEQVGLPGALTGPIARGDVATVRAHVEAIRRDVPDLLPLYAVCGLLAARLAREKGTLPAEDADVIRTILARHEA